MANAKKSASAKKTTAQAQKTVKKTAESAEAQAQKNVKSTFSAIDSNAVTADHMVHAGTEAVKDFIAAGTQEAQHAQEKVLHLSQESLEKWTQSTDKTVRNFITTFALNKEQVDALMESGKIAGDVSRDLQESLMSELNALYNEQVALSKDMLACRTLNDMVELQNRAMQSTMQHLFNHSARMTDAWFKLATDAVEPINTQAAQTTARLNKTLAA
jgi:hypothetical protein